MKKRIRITIEVDTNLTRKEFNDEVVYLMSDSVTISFGEVVFLATELVSDQAVPNHKVLRFKP